MLDHPEGLVLVCGDFNPTSSRITELATRRMTGFTQIINVPTRDSGILDWCLTNHPKLISSPKQLPKIGNSDHYTVFIPSAQSSNAPINTKKRIEKRDLRPSRMRAFDLWIVQQSWDDVLNASLVCDKYDLFTKELCTAVEEFLPIRKVNICLSDKPWIPSEIKALIIKRQKLLHKFGKDSPRYREVRNAVQRECANCKKLFFDSKVAKLKQTNIRR